MVLEIDPTGNEIGYQYDNLDRPIKSGIYDGPVPPPGPLYAPQFPIQNLNYTIDDFVAPLSEELTTTTYAQNKTWVKKTGARVLEPDGTYGAMLESTNSVIDDIGRVLTANVELLTGTEFITNSYNDADLPETTSINHSTHENFGLQYLSLIHI